MVSPPKSKALALAPKFTAFLSICGSIGIIIKVLSSPRRRKMTMHRIVMGMSICDTLASIWYFTSTWAIPAGTLSWFGDGETETIFWAAGDANGVSCSMAGFFNQFAVATPLYNLTLSVYYLLVVNYNWKDNRIQKAEWGFHSIPVGYAILTSTFAAVADMYGHVEWTCWILPEALFDDTQELTPIQSKFKMIQWIFLFGVVWSCVILISITFIILYRKMKFLEKRLTRYSYSSASRLSVSSKNFSSTFTGSKISENSAVDASGSLGDTNGSLQFSSGADIGDSTQFSLDRENKSVQDNDQDSDDAKEPREEASDEDARNVDYEGNPDLEAAAKSLRGAEDVVVVGTEMVDKDSTSEALSETAPDRRRVSWLASAVSYRVNRSEKNEEPMSEPRRERKEAAKSKKIAVQGLLYICAFFVTWLFPTMSRITELVFGKNYFAIQFLDTFLIPLQGFFNFFIYIRPQYLNHRKSHAEDGFFKSLKTVIFGNKD